MVLSIIILIIGTLCFALGVKVKKYKIGSLVTWVNLKKYDNNKASDIMGHHMMLLGVCLVGITRIHHRVIEKHQNVVIAVVILLVIATELSSYYQIYKYAKLEN